VQGTGDEAAEGPGPTGGAGEAPDDDARGPKGGRDRWGIDVALGAASVAARTASEVAGAVGTSRPARAAGTAARWLTQPLAREGEQVRERIEEEAGPAARQVLRQVTPGVVEAVDINDVVSAIDFDAVLDRIDVNRLVARVDVGAVVSQVDVDALVGQVDVNAIVERVDVNAIIERVDVNAIVERVDVDAVVRQVDIAALLDRLDVDAILARIDLDALLSRIDVNALVQRLDVDALVSRTEIGSLVARSTTGVASEALDAVRRQGVGLDNVLARAVNRVLRRDPAALPAGPPLLVGRPALPPGPDHLDPAVADPDRARRGGRGAGGGRPGAERGDRSAEDTGA